MTDSNVIGENGQDGIPVDSCNASTLTIKCNYIGGAGGYGEGYNGNTENGIDIGWISETGNVTH